MKLSTVHPTLIGGRLWAGFVLLAGIAVGMNQWLNKVLELVVAAPGKEPSGAQSWQLGAEALVQLTLITADAHVLACAHDTVVEGKHCGYTTELKVWPRERNAVLDDNGSQIIQPYRTAHANDLIFVAGLWNEPELAMRVHREPPSRYAKRKLPRFVAYCRVIFIGELKRPHVRWDSNGPWQQEQTGLVAKPLSCTLNPPMTP